MMDFKKTKKKIHTTRETKKKKLKQLGHNEQQYIF
jgi:hypothetical protein